MTDCCKINVAELLPHSGRMVLLDRIVCYGDDSLTSELVVRNDGLLGNADAVPAWAGIEYMAQTIAAYAGMMAKLRGEPIRLGFLLGTRRFAGNVSELKVGSTLSVRVDKIMQDNYLGVFDCRIQGVGVEINATLNVYQPPINELPFKHE